MLSLNSLANADDVGIKVRIANSLEKMIGDTTRWQKKTELMASLKMTIILTDSIRLVDLIMNST